MDAERFAVQARDLLDFGIPGTPFTLGKLIVLAVLLTLLFFFNRRVTRWVVDSLLARRHLNVGVQVAVSTLVRYAVATIGVVVILEAVGIDLSAFAVLAGAVGVGLGFGLQNVTSNFVSGLIILIERPIKVGDRVEIGGISGEVNRIGARATTIVTEENIAVIVPNSQFISERVTNWSHTGPLTGFVVRVKVGWTPTPSSCKGCCWKQPPSTRTCCATRHPRSSCSICATECTSRCRSGAPSTSSTKRGSRVSSISRSARSWGVAASRFP
jgi:small-conductance mechanosensitive channel